MGTTQLLLLATGLGLLSVVGRNQWPPMNPASSEELLGRWYIISWAGNMPIPVTKKSSRLPPFTFTRNNMKQLEFRMNIRKPFGCVEFKVPLDDFHVDGKFHAWERHYIFIHFLPGKDHAIAYYENKNFRTTYKMMMLMGRTPDENPGPQAYFEEFVLRKGLNSSYVIRSPQDDDCKLTRDS